MLLKESKSMRATRDDLVNYFNELWLMSPPVLLRIANWSTWQLFYLFALHASAINNFATLLLWYSAYYTYFLCKNYIEQRQKWALT